MYIVIFDDTAYGLFDNYRTCYNWALSKFNGEMFSIFEVTKAS